MTEHGTGAPPEAQGPDPFERYDAAYVLGALSPADRDAYTEHLHTCERCRAAVTELAGMPGLLAQVPADIAEGDTGGTADGPPLPQSTLPRLLAEVDHARRRRRLLTAAMALAACLLAVTAILWRPGTSSPSPSAGPAPRPTSSLILRPLHAAPVTATAQLTRVAWGTRIGLRCTYDGAPGTSERSLVYSLVVVDKQGNHGQAASWVSVPGRPLTITAATAVDTGNIAALEVHSASGATVLSASP